MSALTAHSLYFSQIRNNVPYFISDVIYFIILFFSWLIKLKICEFCLSFQKPTLSIFVVGVKIGV
jgi:hypothetical protein